MTDGEPLTCPHCPWETEHGGVPGARELQTHLTDDHMDVIAEDVDRPERVQCEHCEDYVLRRDANTETADGGKGNTETLAFCPDCTDQ